MAVLELGGKLIPISAVLPDLTIQELAFTLMLRMQPTLRPTGYPAIPGDDALLRHAIVPGSRMKIVHGFDIPERDMQMSIDAVDAKHMTPAAEILCKMIEDFRTTERIISIELIPRVTDLQFAVTSGPRGFSFRMTKVANIRSGMVRFVVELDLAILREAA